jgi:hypothetical protein
MPRRFENASVCDYSHLAEFDFVKAPSKPRCQWPQTMPKFDDFLKSKARPVTSSQSAPLPAEESTASLIQQVSAPAAQAVPPSPSTGSSSSPFNSMIGAAGTRAPASAHPNLNLEHCRPVLRADQANLWSQIERKLESVYQAMVDACASLSIDAYVGRSNAFEFPSAVLFECWLPADNDAQLTERSWASVKIEPKAWHRYETEYTVEIENRGRKKTLGKYGELNASDVHLLLAHLVEGGPIPRLRARLQVRGDPFWRRFTAVENKPLERRTDYLRLAGRLLTFAGLVGFLGIYASLGKEAEQMPVFWLLLLLLGVGGGAAIAFYIRRQPVAVRNPGRPEYQPRILRVYDSWQAVLFAAAPSAGLLRQRFLAILQQPPIDGFMASTERIGYRVLGEPVFREQIVLAARRGILYCQIFEFGTDLYVGWQSFLNQGRWIEKIPGDRIVDRATGRRAEIRDVVPGRENLCEYDYADVNCLTEWTHAQVVMLMKQLMKELQIDQEIDFKIVRGERKGPADSNEKEPAGNRKLSDFFRRSS